jgi:hypothetical protein
MLLKYRRWGINRKERLRGFIAFALAVLLSGCSVISGPSVEYRDQNMDFGSITSVAVLPLANLSREQMAADRVRDILMNMLLSTGAVYVLPPGEVARGISRSGTTNPVAPNVEDVKKLGSILQVSAVVTGVVKEYGELRAGSSTANVISLSLQMIETQSGKVVWSASTTQGGVGPWDRLFGGGGKPINDVTEKAVHDLIQNLLK